MGAWGDSVSDLTRHHQNHGGTKHISPMIDFDGAARGACRTRRPTLILLVPGVPVLLIVFLVFMERVEAACPRKHGRVPTKPAR